MKLSNILFWKLGLATFLLTIIALAVNLWLSGASDTREALGDGRRLLIQLDNGSIEGRQINLEHPEAPSAQAAAPDQSPAAKPETAAAESPASKVETPPETVSPSQTAESPSAPTPAEGEKQEAAAAPAPEAVPAAPVRPQEPEQIAAVAPVNPETMEATVPFSMGESGSVVPSTTPLAATNQALLEKAAAGQVPVIGADGTKPWRYYAKPYERKGNSPMIAIIVTGLGQNKAVGEAALRLPEHFTLSFSPYAKEVGGWANAARVAGHEVLMDLPLQPLNYPATDPGPYGLLISKGRHENASRLQWLMARFQNYVGFITPQNEAFSSSDESFQSLLQALGNRGLMLAMAHDPVKTETKQILDNSQTAHVTADVLLDEELSATAIQARLTILEKAASKRGYAIGIAHAFPITIQQLNLWSAQLEKTGFVLVPVTFLTKLKFS